MGQMAEGLLGSTGQTVEGPRPSPDIVGPMPPVKQGQSGLLGALSAGFAKIQDFSEFLGDTTEERTKNAQKFAAIVKDLGNVMGNAKDSTLVRRMMELQMRQAARTPLAMTGGSGGQGISPIGQNLSQTGGMPAWGGMGR